MGSGSKKKKKAAAPAPAPAAAPAPAPKPAKWEGAPEPGGLLASPKDTPKAEAPHASMFHHKKKETADESSIRFFVATLKAVFSAIHDKDQNMDAEELLAVGVDRSLLGRLDRDYDGKLGVHEFADVFVRRTARKRGPWGAVRPVRGAWCPEHRRLDISSKCRSIFEGDSGRDPVLQNIHAAPRGGAATRPLVYPRGTPQRCCDRPSGRKQTPHRRRARVGRAQAANTKDEAQRLKMTRDAVVLAERVLRRRFRALLDAEKSVCRKLEAKVAAEKSRGDAFEYLVNVAPCASWKLGVGALVVASGAAAVAGVVAARVARRAAGF